MLRTTLLAAFICAAPSDCLEIYDQAPSTELGCQCEGDCFTNVLIECNAAPVCKVKDKNCAKGTAPWSLALTSHYDHCVYLPYKKYEDLPAAKKKEIILQHVYADKEPSQYGSPVDLLANIMGESVRTTFEASADIFPAERLKVIHTVGVTGGIRFQSTGGHRYTGLFEGAEHGVIRFSSAKEPGSDGVTPGMGVKFFRDGRPSANFVAMFSLDGQPCTDTGFFQNTWSNHIAATGNFGLKIIAPKFWQASYCPQMVGLSDLSTDAAGKVGSFPFQLLFKGLVESDCPCDDYAACMAKLSDIQVGSKLFEVSARDSPAGEAKVIGHIILTDGLMTSKFGDEQLFFKHQHMEADFAVQPGWLDAIDKKAQCGMTCPGLAPPPTSKGCSSPFDNANCTKVAGMLSSDMRDSSFIV